jgi:antitoxin YefM
MRTLEEIIAALPAEDRAEVLAHTDELRLENEALDAFFDELQFLLFGGDDAKITGEDMKAEIRSMQETLHLLKSPANAAALRRSLAEADAGQLVERELIEE